VSTIAAIGLGVALVIGRMSPEDAGKAVSRLELTPSTGVELYNGGGQTVATAPDGRSVAFIGVRGGIRQVYLRRLDQFESAALRGTDGAFSCFFSTSGDAIGFVSTNGSLRKISLADGLVVTLTASGADYTGSQTWGPDDQITFNRGAVLWRTASGGGNPRALTALENGELAHVYPAAVSRTAVLFSSLSATRSPRIEAVTPETGRRRVVLDSAMFPMPVPGHLVFFRDDALFAVAFDAESLAVTGVPVRVIEHVGLSAVGAPLAALSPAGTLVYATATTAASTLQWVSRRGAQEPLTSVQRQYLGPRLSPDGRRVVVQAGGDLWIHDIERASFTRLTSSATFGNSFPIWTADGKGIIFRTSMGLQSIVVDREATPRLIPDTSSSDFPTSVSPDGGTLLAVRQTGTTSQDVYAIPLNGTGPPRPIVSTPAFEGGGMFSSDGRWLAYVSDESGQMQVYVRPWPGERRWQVSTEGGTSPVWNRNGRELFYRNGNKVMAVEIEFAGADPALSPPHLLFEHAYTYGSTITIANFDVSPDGQRFVMVQDEPRAGRLAIVLNWTEELKRLSAPR
jgi:serine/threonine-protein kinase